MTETDIKITVHNPRGRIESTPRFPAAPRLKSINNRKIGVLKFGVWGITEKLWPRLETAIINITKDVQFHEWSFTGPPSREERIKEIVEYSDGVIVMLGLTGTSSARVALDAVEIEKLGKPVAFAITRPFEENARFVAGREGLPDISIVVVPLEALPHPSEIDELNFNKFADDVIHALTETPLINTNETDYDDLTFSGAAYARTISSMEKYFLNHGWGDGLPLIPPTREAVDEMLEGTDLGPDHSIGQVEPGGGEATIEKIAINAVMAGCLPQHLPVVIAAVEAIIDPAFDLREVQCTSCNMSPLLIVSGQNLIEDLNINNTFGTIGPGFRANSTIGRAVRLVMINLGHTWPGVNDMKTLGSPFKFIPLMAENEAAYRGAWEPLRVAEGYSFAQPTVSVMPAMSWQPDIVQPEPPTAKRIIEYISKQAKVKHDRLMGNWGMDNLVILCASTFDCIRREGYSRTAFRKALVDAIKIPVSEFLNGVDINQITYFGRLPEELIMKCNSGPDALIPLFAGPENIKICVSGGAGPFGITYTSTFGYGAAHFVTKPVRLPGNWKKIREKNSGWESPLVK